MSGIDTGDVVLHGPTQESWTVAFVKDDRLSWCGWPEGTALLSDCTLVEKATPEVRRGLLLRLASVRGDNSRKRHALEVLTKEGEL